MLKNHLYTVALTVWTLAGLLIQQIFGLRLFDLTFSLAGLFAAALVLAGLFGVGFISVINFSEDKREGKLKLRRFFGGVLAMFSFMLLVVAHVLLAVTPVLYALAGSFLVCAVLGGASLVVTQVMGHIFNRF